jgi:hypothetical protein
MVALLSGNDNWDSICTLASWYNGFFCVIANTKPPNWCYNFHDGIIFNGFDSLSREFRQSTKSHQQKAVEGAVFYIGLIVAILGLGLLVVYL